MIQLIVYYTTVWNLGIVEGPAVHGQPECQRDTERTTTHLTREVGLLRSGADCGRISLAIDERGAEVENQIHEQWTGVLREEHLDNDGT
jgi:hypothetical protein